MKSTLLLALFLLFAPASNAQEVAGDWHGTLKAGSAELRLVMHIFKGADGSVTTTLDSIDQGAKAVPVTSTTLRDSVLKLSIDALRASYEGKLNAGGSAISGTWTQGQPLPLEFRRGTFPVVERKPAKASDIDGAWIGTINTGAANLRIVFHIVNTADGLTATADSPDQGASGLPVTSVTRKGAVLTIEMKALAAVFEGKISPDLKTIDGTFTQNGGSIPLVLSRASSAAMLPRPRPQNPAKPYPYREEEVDYQAPGAHLAATLTVPPGEGPFPAVVLITGSGPQDRDESLMGHRPFLVLADYLTRKGIAALRADDRGVGESTGAFATATTADFANDAEAGVVYLETRKEINSRKIGLIGHSEGGVVAPMVAARNRDVAFIVLMAGTGVPGSAVLPAQVEAIMLASGKSAEEAAERREEQHEVLDLALREKDDSVLEKRLAELTNGRMPPAQIKGQIQQIRSSWFRYFLEYDPAVALRKVKCPVLAINGEKDRQVLPSQNLPEIRKALEAGGNIHFTVEEMPGLNHLFQTAKTGSPGEYSEIEETIAPAALARIASWILKH